MGKITELEERQNDESEARAKTERKAHLESEARARMEEELRVKAEARAEKGAEVEREFVEMHGNSTNTASCECCGKADVPEDKLEGNLTCSLIVTV